MANISSTFVGLELIEQSTAGRPKRLLRTGRCFPEERLELGKDLLDGIEVGAVRRQITNVGTRGLNGLGNAGHLVRAEVVHHDDIARSQYRHQCLLDPGAKGMAIDGAVEHAGRRQATGTQGADKRGRMPVAIRRLPGASRSFGRTSPCRGHVGTGPSLIQKYQAPHVQMVLLSGPGMTGLRYVRPFPLGGTDRLFFRLSPSRTKVFHMVVTLT